ERPGAVPCLVDINHRGTMTQGNSRVQSPTLSHGTDQPREVDVERPGRSRRKTRPRARDPGKQVGDSPPLIRRFTRRSATQTVTTGRCFALFAHAPGRRNSASLYGRSQMRVEARKGSRQGES